MPRRRRGGSPCARIRAPATQSGRRPGSEHGHRRAEMTEGVERAALSRRRFLGGGGAAAGALALGAGRWATAASASPSAAAIPWVPTLDPVAGAVPTEARIHGWIEQVVAQGIRRPGYPAAAWAEEFAADRFRALGLED